MKNVYAFVPFFKEAIITADRKTIAIVDNVAQDIGKYIIPIINARTKIVDTFSRDFSIDFLFWRPINIKHPAAISQNLVGIRKYAADWFAW